MAISCPKPRNASYEMKNNCKENPAHYLEIKIITRAQYLMHLYYKTSGIIPISNAYDNYNTCTQDCDISCHLVEISDLVIQIGIVNLIAHGHANEC